MSTPFRPASLPMYDADPAAVQGWWGGIAAAMEAEGVAGVPRIVDWPSDLDAHWHDPRLLLSQTCGYPLVTRLAGVVQVVGAFRYTAPGCEGIFYRSRLLARSGDSGRSIEDFRGRVAAINDPDSYSGCRALRSSVAPMARDGRFFESELESGSHRGSLHLLRDGRADIAAIDCVTLAGIGRRTPELLLGLEVIDSTAPAPGLPLVTSADTPPAELGAMRRALAAASVDPGLADVREALFIGGFEAVSATTWTSNAAIGDSASSSDE